MAIHFMLPFDLKINCKKIFFHKNLVLPGKNAIFWGHFYLLGPKKKCHKKISKKISKMYKNILRTMVYIYFPYRNGTKLVPLLQHILWVLGPYHRMCRILVYQLLSNSQDMVEILSSLHLLQYISKYVIV